MSNKITLKEIPQLGRLDEKYHVWRQTDAERKRPDIDPKKLYLVEYEGIWLIGRFSMAWYGWNFYPNMGSMRMQIEWLSHIFEITDGIILNQKVSGDTASHILGYLEKETEKETEKD